MSIIAEVTRLVSEPGDYLPGATQLDTLDHLLMLYGSIELEWFPPHINTRMLKIVSRWTQWDAENNVLTEEITTKLREARDRIMAYRQSDKYISMKRRGADKRNLNRRLRGLRF